MKLNFAEMNMMSWSEIITEFYAGKSLGKAWRDNLSVHQCESIHKLIRVQEQILFLTSIGLHLFFCLICLSLLPLAQPLLVEVPTNKAVWQDGSSEEIVMSCKSDQPARLSWSVQKNTNSVQETLFSGYFLHPDAQSYCMVIADEPGKYYLLLNNTPEAAQTYICLEPGSLSMASADLIWFGSDLMCNYTSTEELLILICDIEFRGNWVPTMEWKRYSDDGEQVLTGEANTSTVQSQRVTSTLVMPVEHGRINYTCTVKFDISGKPRGTTATNVPNFEKHWSTLVSIKSQDETPENSDVTTVNVLRVVVPVVGLAAAGAGAVICCIIVIKRWNEEKKRKQQRRENLLLSKEPISTVLQPLNSLSDPTWRPIYRRRHHFTTPPNNKRRSLPEKGLPDKAYDVRNRKNAFYSSQSAKSTPVFSLQN